MSAHGKKNDDLLKEVLERAATNKDFRARLLAEPVSAIRMEFGVILPHDYRIKFVERPRDLDALIVLPDAGGRGELDEDDLDMVAGGGDTEVSPCGSW
jgi:hypothetical protein